MVLMRLLLGRRRFLEAFLGTVLMPAFKGIAVALNPVSPTARAEVSEASSTKGERPLKGIVVYYSASGNTARIADAIYRGMRSIIACDVAPIDRIRPADMARYDIMAIGSPNWFMREPANVKIFTHDMPRMDGRHCVIFGTHGSTPVGQFWSISRNILKKGMTIIGWSDWYGTNLLEGSQPDGEWGHPDEIDIAEAEAFGRRIAEHSVRIYGGEIDLVPEIPRPDKGQDSLWSHRVNDFHNISFASPRADIIPQFDLTRCVYPRCDRCIENCPVHAIDLSMMATGSILSGDSTTSPLVLKEACQHCGGLCERVCLYDAILYTGEKRESVFNMERCTHPKCTACVDNCPQDAIDFSAIPPTIHNRCEGGDYICFDVCPQNAIEYPSMTGESQVGPHGGPQEETEETDEAAYWSSNYGPRFRPLITLKETGTKGTVMSFDVYPRVLIDKEPWPYHMEESWSDKNVKQ